MHHYKLLPPITQLIFSHPTFSKTLLPSLFPTAIPYKSRAGAHSSYSSANLIVQTLPLPPLRKIICKNGAHSSRGETWQGVQLPQLFPGAAWSPFPRAAVRSRHDGTGPQFAVAVGSFTHNGVSGLGLFCLWKKMSTETCWALYWQCSSLPETFYIDTVNTVVLKNHSLLTAFSVAYLLLIFTPKTWLIISCSYPSGETSLIWILLVLFWASSQNRDRNTRSLTLSLNTSPSAHEVALSA